MRDLVQQARWLIRDIAFLPLTLPGAAWACRRFGRKNAILSFHNVLECKFDNKKLIHNVDLDVTTFKSQLHFLKANYKVLPISKINDWPNVEGIFLSFDDGLLNNYTTVLPILEEFGVTAMFAVCPDLVNQKIPYLWRDWLYLGLSNLGDFQEIRKFESTKCTGPSLTDSNLNSESLFRKICPDLYSSKNPYEKLAEWFPHPHKIVKNNEFIEKRFRPMSWAQIEELRYKGHVIASHLMTHRPPRYMAESQLIRELIDSKNEISKNINQACNYLVFPYGNKRLVNARAIEIAKNQYRILFMNESDNIYQNTLPLFSLPHTSSRVRLLASIAGYLERLKK